jgi:SAM-dependent MidA family methyltransferase
MDAVDDIKKEEDHDFVSKLITQYFSHKIFDAVTDFIMKKSNEEIYQNDVVSDNEDDDDYGDEDQQEDDFEEEHNRQKAPKRDRNQFIEARKKREKERQLREIKRWEFP